MYMESLYFDAFAMFMNQITYNITISLSKACLIVFFCPDDILTHISHPAIKSFGYRWLKLGLLRSLSPLIYICTYINLSCRVVSYCVSFWL